MPKKLKVTLNEEQLELIEEAIKKDNRPKVVERAKAIRALHLGKSVADVAIMQAVTVQSVYNWVHRWEADGLEGLADKAGRGRKPKADEAYCQKLEAAIDQEPQDLGYRFALWTIERLRDHLEQKTGVALSISRLRVVIKERGYVYRRPRHDLKNLQDPAAREAAHQLIGELKKGRSRGISGSSLWTKQP